MEHKERLALRRGKIIAIQTIKSQLEKLEEEYQRVYDDYLQFYQKTYPKSDDDEWLQQNYNNNKLADESSTSDNDLSWDKKPQFVGPRACSSEEETGVRWITTGTVVPKRTSSLQTPQAKPPPPKPSQGSSGTTRDRKKRLELLLNKYQVPTHHRGKYKFIRQRLTLQDPESVWEEEILGFKKFMDKD